MIQIEEIQTEFGAIAVTRNPSTGTMIYKVGGRQQGMMDRSGTSLAYYIHALFGLLTQAGARSILMIGGAGCTLGSMLARAGCRTAIVDVNPASFVVARRHFGLPDSVICHAAEGEQFLRGETGAYDGIVLDAFHGDDIPPHLQSSQFFGLVRERLAPGGVMLANVLVANDSDESAGRVANSMKHVWTDVRVLDAAGISDRNAIVMAGQVSQLREPDLLMPPVTNPHVIARELGRLKFRDRKATDRFV
jgi:spermidine synthase